MLEAVLSKTDEDHLRVALIQPGSSRYEQMKAAAFSVRKMNKQTDIPKEKLQQGWNRVFYVPCNRNIARDFFARISRVL